MIRLGILGCAEIAYRRFMPAALSVEGLDVVAVGEEYATEKLKNFCEDYKLKGYTSFKEMIEKENLDAVYIPQPPSLHFEWAKYALEHGLHVLVEKPSTTEYELSKSLVGLASANKLALHENYMFQYHSQIAFIKKIIEEKEIGDIRLIRLNFGFPLRMQNDFRYVKKLGGGALLDAGGYTVKLATILLGEDIKVDAACLNNLEGYEVDMYGSATLSNDSGVVCQVGFGMDSFYQCNIEVWGSKGKLVTDRVFTAPPDFAPILHVFSNNGCKNIELERDAHFSHSIEAFIEEISNDDKRKSTYNSILLQSKLIKDIFEKGNAGG